MKKKLFEGYFYYRKDDRKAILAVAAVLLLLLGAHALTSVLPHGHEEEKEQDATTEVKGTTSTTVQEHPLAVLHAFDPNTVDSLTLVRLGLRPWKVKNFLHYRSAGKVFRSADDLGDTYGWTTEDVKRLAPYVQVSAAVRQTDNPRSRHNHSRKEQAEHTSQSHQSESRKFQALTQVDLNEADTALLRRIPGVGEKISQAIVRYRQRLGGFASVSQLHDLKQVSPELHEWFTVSSPSSVRKISINTASFQVLNAHPYISYEQTQSLLRYIRLYGPVKDEEALASTAIFTPAELERLRPYILYE